MCMSKQLITRVFVVVGLFCFAMGFAAVHSQFLIAHFHSDYPSLVAIADAHPAIGGAVTIMMAFACVAFIRLLKVGVPRTAFGDIWFRASYFACVSGGAGELLGLACQYLDRRSVSSIVVLHAFLFLLIGVMGLVYAPRRMAIPNEQPARDGS